MRLKVERSPRRLFNALAKECGFAAGYLRLWRVNWHRFEDKTIHLGSRSARPRHGEQAFVAPYLFSPSRKTTRSRTKSRRCNSASAAENGSLLTNITWITC